jgi:hypothetical protein
MWATVAADRDLSWQFTARDIFMMTMGLAPEAPFEFRNGGQTKYEIHHPNEIRELGLVYDMRNMMIVTPTAHRQIHNGSSGDD